MLLCGSAFSQTTVKFDFTGDEGYGMTLLSGTTSDYNPDPFTFDGGGVSVTLNGRTRWWKASGGNQLRFYKDSKMEISVPAGNVITGIKMTAKAPGSFTASVGTYDAGTWTGKAEKVTISCTITSGNTAVSSFEVTYAASSGPVKNDPALAFSESNVGGTVGIEFTAPTLTKATDGAITYSSSDETMATVDAQTGAVTLVAAGTVVITATAAETDTYNSGSASYTIDVSAPVLEVVSVPYSETFSGGMGSFVIDNVSMDEALSYVWKHDAGYGYMKASAYSGGSNRPAESWLVSPWIEIPAEGEASYLTFDQCVNKYFGTVSDEATLWVKEEGGQWQQLTITYPAIKSTGNWSDFETQNVSMAGYAGKTIKVGFRYVSTASAAGTWEIKNFTVGMVTDGIDNAVIDNGKTADKIYSISGQRLTKVAKGLNIINGKKIVVR